MCAIENVRSHNDDADMLLHSRICLVNWPEEYNQFSFLFISMKKCVPNAMSNINPIIFAYLRYYLQWSPDAHFPCFGAMSGLPFLLHLRRFWLYENPATTGIIAMNVFDVGFGCSCLHEPLASATSCNRLIPKPLARPKGRTTHRYDIPSRLIQYILCFALEWKGCCTSSHRTEVRYINI